MTDDIRLPIIYKNALDVYNKLDESSTIVSTDTLIEYGYPSDKVEPVKIYTGYSSKLTLELGYPPSTGQHAMNLLKGMRCIEMVRIGSKIRPSIYVLNYTPTPETYAAYKGHEWLLDRRINPSKHDSLLIELNEIRETNAKLKERVSALEHAVLSLKGNIDSIAWDVGGNPK